jgi:hypothetical protein
MNLTLDEQRLLAEFRTLDETGRKELLETASNLAKRWRGQGNTDDGESAGQCQLEEPKEKRPETTKEPIFTE